MSRFPMSSSFPVPLVTHSGAFHADEVVACALLLLTRFKGREWRVVQASGAHYAGPNRTHENQVVILRTRSEALLVRACADQYTYVMDVGAQHNPAMLNFDHHQKAFTATWDDGAPLSAAGLVYHHLLPEYPELRGLETHVRAIDKADNGIESYAWSESLDKFNRGKKAAVQCGAFTRAVQATLYDLENRLFVAACEHTAERLFSEAWQAACERGDTLLLLREGFMCAAPGDLAFRVSQGRASLIVAPEGTSGQTVLLSATRGERFSVKTPTPDTWRGVDDKILHVPDPASPEKTDAFLPLKIVFSHKNGYLTIVRGERELALRVAYGLVSGEAREWALTPNTLARTAKPGL